MKLAAILLAGVVSLALVPELAAAQKLSVEQTLAALGKGPTLGKADTPVTIVEFSDFQCSFCKKFWAQTLPKLKETYIQKGQVRFIYRHFAILGKLSVQAAQGAECAGEQGKFWQYHDKLFASQGTVFTEAKLKQYARELKLNVSAFDKCLGSSKYKKKIEDETAVAAFLGATGTPSFFINGKMRVGAQPFEVFKMAIERERKKAASKKK